MRELGLATFLVCLCLVCALVWPSFAAPGNLRDLLVNNVILLVGALGVSLVIVAGGIDISIGAILALAAVAAGRMDAVEASPAIVAAASIAVGLVLGLANGVLSALGRVHSIVITLGTLSIFRSLVLQVTGGRHILNLSPAVTWFGQANLLGIPVILLAGVGAFWFVHEILHGSVAGRWIYATGSRREHADVLGVPTEKVRVACFALCGALVGLAGLLYAGRYGQVQTNVGLGFELRAIAAAVIGGVSIMGGRGSALGILLGTLLLGVLTNVIVLSRVSAFWEGVVVGASILVAVAVDGFAQHAAARRGGRGLP